MVRGQDLYMPVMHLWPLWSCMYLFSTDSHLSECCASQMEDNVKQKPPAEPKRTAVFLTGKKS